MSGRDGREEMGWVTKRGSGRFLAQNFVKSRLTREGNGPKGGKVPGRSPFGGQVVKVSPDRINIDLGRYFE